MASTKPTTTTEMDFTATIAPFTDYPNDTMAPFTGHVPIVTLPPEYQLYVMGKNVTDICIEKLTLAGIVAPIIDLMTGVPVLTKALGEIKSFFSLGSTYLGMLIADEDAKVELSKIQNITAMISLCEATIEYQSKKLQDSMNDVVECEDLAKKSKASLTAFRSAMNRAHWAAMRHFDHISQQINLILDSVERSKHEVINSVARAKVHILDEAKRMRVERLLSRLSTMLNFYIAEAQMINSLPLEQRLEMLERKEGIFKFIDTALRGDDPGTMYSLLMAINEDNLAAPTSPDDMLGLSGLRLLCFGVEVYSFMVMFKVQQTMLLAKNEYYNFDFQQADSYLGIISGMLKNNVESLSGLITTADKALNAAKSVTSHIKDFDEFSNATHTIFRLINEDLVQSYVSFANHSFTIPQDVYNIELYWPEEVAIKAPISDWLPFAEVSYAIQYLGNNNVSSKVGEFVRQTDPEENSASPVVYIGSSDANATRVVFRQINSGIPQVVAILPDQSFTVFTDMTRDLYNCAKEPNLELSLQSTNVYLEYGTRADMPFDESNSALHWAAENNNWPVAQALLQNGTNVEVHNEKGFTPLYIAAQKGYLDFVGNLLEYGANVSATTNDANMRFTPLHTAASRGFDDIVRLLIRQASIDLNARSVEGFTPLHYAATFNQDKVAATLLGASGVDAKAQSLILMLSPLHSAAIYDSDKVAQLLIDNDKAAIESKAFEDSTPLHLAALHGSTKVVDVLLNNSANFLAKLSDNSIPLHMAAFGGNKDTISSLLRKDEDPKDEDVHPNIDLINDDDETPLYIAMKFNNIAAAKKLLHKHANINIQVKDHRTLLHMAALKGDLTAAVNLLDAGISVKVRDEDSLTALNYAVQHNNLDIASEILDHGGDVNYVAKDRPLIHSVVDLREYDALNMVQMFANHNAMLDIVDRNKPQNTFFHVVCAKGMLQVAKFLYSQGVRIDKKNSDGKTALDLAEENKHNEVVEFLKSIKSNSARRRRDVSEVDEQFGEQELGSNQILDLSQNTFAKQVASSAGRPVGLISQAIGSLVSTFKSLPCQLASLMPFSNSNGHSAQSAIPSGHSTDLNGTLLLLDVIVRKYSGERYVDTSLSQSITPEEARLYALELVEQLHTAMDQLAQQSDEGEFEFDLFQFYQSVEKLVLSGQYDQIERLMHSTAREAFHDTKISHSLIAKRVERVWNQICSPKQNSQPNFAAMHPFANCKFDQTAQNAQFGDVLVSKQNLI